MLSKHLKKNEIHDRLIIKNISTKIVRGEVKSLTIPKCMI